MGRSSLKLSEAGSRRFALLLLTALLSPFPALAQQKYSAKGMVIAVDKEHRLMTVSCEAIPGYMDAMVMPIEVRDAHELDGLAPSTMIDFSLVSDKDHPYAENLRIRNSDSLELDPDEGQLIHSLHTLIIDRHGRMAVNLEGNEFTPQELGDLLQSMLNGSTSSKAH